MELEIVLPSGKVAHFRELLFGDLVGLSTLDAVEAIAIIASRICEIDGQYISPDEFLRMKVEEVMPINNMIATMLSKNLSEMRGVA